MNSTTESSGIFRRKKGFTITSNEVVRDRALSLKAKGLYTLIRSWITLEDIVLTKEKLRANCSEKTKAFDSAWNELKQNGYLKIHLIPSEQGRFLYEYELLDTAELRDGVYLYRYDRGEKVTSTNLGPVDPDALSHDHHPQKGTGGDHHPLLRGSAKHASGKRDSANGGSNLILNSKTKNKTEENHSLYPASAEKGPIEGENESAMMDFVRKELAGKKAIPYPYALQPDRMTAAVHYLCEYDFRLDHPYSDSARQNAFELFADCLAEMACDQRQQNYRGSLVTYAKVINAINANSDGCTEGGLGEFSDAVLEDFLQAEQNTEIKNIRQYMKSVIWNCFSTYKVKIDAYIGRMR